MYKKYKIFFISFITTFLILIFLVDGIIKYADFVIKPDKRNMQEALNYSYWLKRKIEIANSKTGKKRIIIAGDSSVLFGVNAKQIEDYYKIPTINFGLHAAFPHINYSGLKTVIKKGDILIITTSFNFAKKTQKFIAQKEIVYLFLYDKDMYKNFDINNKASCICYFLRNIYNIRPKKDLVRFEKNIPPDFESPYSIKYWNNNGDITYNRIQDKEKTEKEYIRMKKSLKYKIKSFSKEDLDYIKSKKGYIDKFVVYANSIGADIYFMDSVQMKIFDMQKEPYKTNYNLKDVYKAGGYKFLDKENEFFYDKKYFYDTNAHLTSEGAKIRTKKIIELMDKLGVIK